MGHWRSFLLVPLAAYLGAGALAAVRSLSPPRVAIDVSEGVATISVETPARVETWLDVDLVRDGRTERVLARVVPRSRWAFWNPFWQQARFEIPLRGEGPATLRASVQPGPVWLWQRPPVTQERMVRLGQ